MRNISSIIVAVLINLIFSFFLCFYLISNHQSTIVSNYKSNTTAIPVHFAALSAPVTEGMSEHTTFVQAARIANPTVVNITTNKANKQTPNAYSNPFGETFGNESLDQWLGYPDENAPQTATGSGVIISPDGYIVTNNHVIEGGDDIFITLYNKKSYYAKIIGTDPNTDLALLKINAQGLAYARYGDSDKVQVGEGVLAVGNPFNLTSTVTAGIISAKARHIDILKNESAIEAFIQTDAVVNPGNSGGALVNVHGQLIGINTAIASPTGSFAGYSFAVPINIVRKVVDDLKKHGAVQRAYLGVNVIDIDDVLAKELKLDNLSGVYVSEVFQGGAAHDAGIQKGDILIEINGHRINSSPELQEKMARFRPGDPIAISLSRNGKRQFTKVILKSRNKDTALIKAPKDQLKELLGATFTEASRTELRPLALRYGIKVTKVLPGLFQENRIRPGFVITKIDNKVMKNVEDLAQYLNNLEMGKGVMVEGFYIKEKQRTFYAFSLDHYSN